MYRCQNVLGLPCVSLHMYFTISCGYSSFGMPQVCRDDELHEKEAQTEGGICELIRLLKIRNMKLVLSYSGQLALLAASRLQGGGEDGELRRRRRRSKQEGTETEKGIHRSEMRKTESLFSISHGTPGVATRIRRPCLLDLFRHGLLFQRVRKPEKCLRQGCP